MVKLDDALELLLPDAEPALARRARDMVQFLRLLVADGRGEPASRVGVDFEVARLDLEGGARRELRTALLEIVRQHLAHATGCDSFAWCGAPRVELQACWTLVTETRAELSWMPALPAPGEAACAVAGRALAAAERLESEGDEIELWRARLARAQSGRRAGEEAFRRGLAALLAGPALGTASAAAWIAGLCECLLDRGAVREARALLLEQRDRVASDARLCQLLCWCKLLLGDEEGARALQGGRRAPDAPLPGPLHALRAQRPAWLGLLPQRFVESARVAPRATASCERSEIGASVCVLFELVSTGELRASRIDAAPGLRAGLESWLAGQRFAPQDPGSLQQRLVLEQRTLVAHRGDEPALAETLGCGATLALALVPLATPRGELAGWVHFEFEHHLVPREERLCAFARALSTRRLATVEDQPAGVRPRLRDGEQSLFAGLVERLALRGPQRRWWGFRVHEGRPTLAAEGGDSTLSAPDAPAGQALLGRVLLAGGHLGFAEPDPALSLRQGSQSGIALALRFGGRVAGILVVESQRRADLSWPGGTEREGQLVQAAASLRLEAFRERHRERHGADVWFDLESPDFLSFSARLFRAAESECSVLFAGPSGSGKTVLARWLHHESGRARAELLELRPAALASDSAWKTALARARGATLLLESVERLDLAAQERVLRWLESRRGARASDSCPRLLATTSTTAAGLGLALDAALTRQLERVRFDLPGLRARRFEIPALAHAILARLAVEEGVRAPALDDSALALLWRQSWEGNLGELEGTLQRALLFATGPVLSAADFDRLAARFGRTLVRRLPSRHPLRSDLAAALRSTLLGTGRVNKTRAAAYLGWDPDTLVARLADLGLDGSSTFPDSTWDAPPVAAPRGEGSVGVAMEEAAAEGPEPGP